MDCIMLYVFSLRVLKQIGEHIELRTKYQPHSFILLNGKTMYSHDQILINPKKYGLVHNVCVEKYAFADALF